ncbi:hypothetical protein GJAV_G00129030 [Gymnothorax javanicus]|nr:hypothetical protein GJAV_G00129030 [Gymnothorax javanicus]
MLLCACENIDLTAASWDQCPVCGFPPRAVQPQQPESSPAPSQRRPESSPVQSSLPATRHAGSHALGSGTRRARTQPVSSLTCRRDVTYPRTGIERISVFGLYTV